MALRHNRKATRPWAALVVLTAACAALAGCGQANDRIAEASGASLGEKARAIQDDPKLSPTQKAIAVNQLENAEVKKALDGQSPATHP